ncbi:MAG: 23S rRNA (pseudouridine(1915)-N(3))-methyltransferase RlmH [Myxococcales bacterium]|nr:23S rRNA (pseudouridine(1915)-N(3))-methyltransferase RlmH [Myxococcales bacterium]
MKIRLIVVGRDRNDPICLAADDYVHRLRRAVTFEVVEVKETPLRKTVSPQVAKAEEAGRIYKVLEPTFRSVALDCSGREMSSEELAGYLEMSRDRGLRGLSIVIGGPSGLDAQLLRQVNERWCLSKFTLPHRIARLMICEQMYRAYTILRGEPYHK